MRTTDTSGSACRRAIVNIWYTDSMNKENTGMSDRKARAIMNIILLMLVLTIISPLAAMAEMLDSDGERFKARLIKTYNAPGVAGIKTLLHPKSLECLRAEPKYENYLMRAETLQPIPVDANASVQSLAADAKLPYRGFEFPLRPSHVMRFEFGRKQLPDRSAITEIAEKHILKDGGRWYLIMPCATPEGLKRLNDMGLLD